MGDNIFIPSYVSYSSQFKSRARARNSQTHGPDSFEPKLATLQPIVPSSRILRAKARHHPAHRPSSLSTMPARLRTIGCRAKARDVCRHSQMHPPIPTPHPAHESGSQRTRQMPCTRSDPPSQTCGMRCVWRIAARCASGPGKIPWLSCGLGFVAGDRNITR